MPLGTIDRTPPPFFRQGTSALTKLAFFSALSVFVMVADSRFQVVAPLRAALAFALLPVQRALAVPLEMWDGGSDYLRGLHDARSSEKAARARLAEVAERAARTEQLAQENARLRGMLDLRPALTVPSVTAEVMFEAADPYSRRVFIDKGSMHSVVAGSPVINDAGVLGQVTRVYMMTSEVTLLTDKDAAIPVLNVRTQQRSAAFGFNGGIELRYVSGQADVKVGDALHTSGLDGVYPPGLPVAQVASVERRQETGFARIVLAPAAPSDGVRHVLVLQPVGMQLPARPAPAAADAPVRGERQLSTPRRSAPGSAAAASAAPSALPSASPSASPNPAASVPAP
jgi:rod shape-determining protein MreC